MAEKQGIWKLRKSLVLDPETATFPLRCIFTDEPVDELTSMKLIHVRKSRYGGYSKKQRTVFLPISDTWRDKRNRRAKLLSRLLMLVGLAILVGGVVIPMAMGMAGQQRAGVMGVTLPLGILTLIVAPFLPYLDDFNGSSSIYNVEALKDGRWIVHGVHPELLNGVPELEFGMLHGLLGIEAVRELEAKMSD